MPSRNPFLDLEAYGSSDEDDFEEQAPGVDDEDGAGSEEEIGEEEIEEEEEEEEEAGTLKATNDGEYEDEDALNRYSALRFSIAWNDASTRKPWQS
ncbi:hypothetical protein VKT23_020615 [Stygiomarasmius scandens]|uniref:Uncharacterized protein n=1 Tax=Marasmiellus scandens TaxID=2682957 RepID=A0ABR1IIP8_9AGAR